MTKEYIYEHMTIDFIDPDPEIEFEFADGKPCMDLYGEALDACARISERTGIDQEDHDLVQIISSMEEIAKICGLKMFDYGVKYGRHGH